MYLGYFICIRGILKDWRGIIGILGKSKKGSGGVNDGRNLTNGNGFGNFVGKTWEKLGTFGNGFQSVTKINGNFVGITWE
jgi:hypothetical protein